MANIEIGSAPFAPQVIGVLRVAEVVLEIQVAKHELVVERFIDLYEDFLRTPIPDPDARLEQVRSWRRLAYLYLEVGRRDDADRAYSSGVIAARDLSARGNRSPQLRLEVALASGYAGVSKSARRKDGSLELNFAFGELNALAAASPSDAAPLREHSELLNRYAAVIPNQNLKLKLFAEAIGLQRQALRLAFDAHFGRRVRSLFRRSTPNRCR